MTTITDRRAIGEPLDRRDGPLKVTGTAPYAYEHHFDSPLYLFPVQSEIARGRVTQINASAATALPGVLAVLTHDNAPRLADTSDQELAVLQAEDVAFRGQYVAATVAETLEIARYAASLILVSYDEEPHDVELRANRADLYAPELVNAGYPTDTADGDFDREFDAAPVTLDQTYTTPMEHHNPMEPHTTVALWEAGDLTLYESSQGAHWIRDTLAQVFGLDQDRVRIISPYVGGGFGSKTLHANTILATLGARAVQGRPVKFALTRQQMFSGVGYRTPPSSGSALAPTMTAASSPPAMTSLPRPPKQRSSLSRPPFRPGRCTQPTAAAPLTV